MKNLLYLLVAHFQDEDVDEDEEEDSLKPGTGNLRLRLSLPLRQNEPIETSDFFGRRRRRGRRGRSLEGSPDFRSSSVVNYFYPPSMISYIALFFSIESGLSK